jgi:TetR/AcrR family transcriptional regulator, tetracycline repressor protein
VYLYVVQLAYTLYSCQVATEKLTRTAVIERAMKLADVEGVEAVTIRRLAQELGVTAMALYWHFKNKDELLLGIADHALLDVKATRSPDDPWQHQLRAMVEALVGVMRAHPSLATLLHSVDKEHAESFARATNDALELLARGGFGLQESYWVASYLLQGAIGLVNAQPGCPVTMSPAEATEWRRQRRLHLERLPADQYPMIVAYAKTIEDEPDVEAYYTLGIDLLLAGVEGMAG